MVHANVDNYDENTSNYYKHHIKKVDGKPTITLILCDTEILKRAFNLLLLQKTKPEAGLKKQGQEEGSLKTATQKLLHILSSSA